MPRIWIHGTLIAGLVFGCAAPTINRTPAAPGRTTMVTYDEVAASPAPPADHREAYGSGPLQFGELRIPKQLSRAPVVVFLHGGCWRAAYDLAHTAAAAAALVEAGYAVWVPEYRRVGDDGGGWPGTFEDVGNAIDHVRVLASRYPVLDTTRVIVAGHSAGGQLALWGASRRPGEWPSASRGTDPLRVTGVVSLAGITDMAAYASPSGCGSAVVPLMGGTQAAVPDRYRLVSPIERVPLGVPVRIVHGAADPIVPVGESHAFAARLTAAGEHPVVTEVAGAGHFDVVAPQSAAWPAVIEAMRALTAAR
jgi:acetyl esterase/lipase